MEVVAINMVNMLRNYKIALSFSYIFSLIFSYLKCPCIFYLTEILLHCEFYKSLIAFVFMSAHLRQGSKNTLNR